MLINKILILICVITQLSLFSSSTLSKTNILVIQDFYHFPRTRLFNSGLVEVQQTYNHINFYMEHMNRRIEDGGISDEHWKEYLQKKYTNIKIDAIISSSPDSSIFLLKSEKMFGNLPIAILNQDTEAFTNPVMNFKNNIKRAIAKTVDIASKQNPSIKKALLVTDRKGLVLSTLSKNLKQKGISLDILNVETAEQVNKDISQITKKHIIFYEPIFKDKNKNYITPKELLKSLTKNSKMPIYSFWSPLVDTGIVGGHVVDTKNLAKQMTEALVYYTKNNKFPKQYPNLKTYLNWETMERFSINTSNIPKETIILNKPKSFIELYYKEISISLLILILFFILTIYWNLRLKKLNKELKQFIKIQDKQKTQLNEERNKYKQLMDLSTDMIVILDSEGKIIECNLETENELQYNKNELLHMNINNLDKKITKEFFEQFKFKIQKEGVNSIESIFKRKDKTDFSVGIIGKFIILNEKQVLYIKIRNITTIKLLEEQTKLASMGEMLSNIAHQWRQPLSVISTGATGLILKNEYDELSDKNLKKTCYMINDNAQYLSQTIDDFRNFIKGDTKAIPFNLKDTIYKFMKLVSSSTKKYQLNIIIDIEDNIKTNGYPNELIQCFMNIFNNSKDAFVQNNINEEDRYIFITQYLDDDKVIITFKDSANGIPEDILPRIFEPYFTTKHQSQGTGLGLSMSYKLIVEEMHGLISAYNVEYEYDNKTLKGVEFKITLSLG